MQDIIFFGNISNGPEKHPHIGDKCHQRTQTDTLVQHAVAPVENHYSQGKDSQKFNKRHKDSEDSDLPHTGQIVFMIDRFKPLKVFSFHTEELDDFHAADGFG